MFASIFALLIFSAVLIWIASLYSGNISSSDYHLAGRKVGSLRLAASTFTLIGGGEFVTLTALSYFYGAWSMIFFGGAVAGFVIMALLAPRAMKYSESAGLHSLPDYFGLYFGRVVSIPTTILASISLGALLVIQLAVGGLMLNLTTNLPVWICTIGMATVVCIYVYLGGFNGVLTTDLIQAVAMFIVVIILVFSYSTEGGISFSEVTKADFPPLGDAAILILGGIFAVLGGADVWQRILSAEDAKKARTGLLVNAGGWLIFGIFLIILASKIQLNHPDADANTAFFLMLETGLPDWLSALASILLFSALISTADTEMFVLSVMANKELTRGQKPQEISTKTTKIYVIVITVIACILALLSMKLIDTYFLLLYLMMILGPIALSRLLGRGTPILALLGIIGGVSVLITLIVIDSLSGAYPLLIVLPPLVVLFRRGTDPLEIEGYQ